MTGVGTDGTIASFGDPSLSYSYYSGTTLLAGAPTAAGAYTVVANYTSDNPNYTDADSSAVSFTIAKADASVLVYGYSGVYDGQAHGASLGHATGIGGVDLSSGVTLGAASPTSPAALPTGPSATPTTTTRAATRPSTSVRPRRSSQSRPTA